MLLSSLQRFILKDVVDARTKHVPRKRFSGNFSHKSVTKSLERLIDRGLLVGYGKRTPKKWYIEEVRLTPFGRGVARKLYGTQQKLLP